MQGLSYDICLISNEPWGDVWYSKQHYAYELSKMGFDVLFLNPVSGWQPKHIFSRKMRIRTSAEHPRLTIANYHNNFPIRVFPKTLQRINDWLVCKKLFSHFNGKKVLFWQFDPTRLIYLSKFSSYKRIYHVVDPMDAFWGDMPLSQKVDLVLCVREEFVARYKPAKEQVLFIPHGVSTEESNLTDYELRSQITEKYQSCILFVGTLNPDVDFSLLLQLTDHYQDKHFLFVGPQPTRLGVEKKEPLETLLKKTNVSYLNSVPAKLLKYYVSTAAVCLVPYDSKQTSFKRTPLKIINYLSQKKPVVSTVRIKDLEGEAIFYAENAQQFIELVGEALQGRLSIHPNKIEEYLAPISYPNLIQRILNQLTPRLDN